MRFLIGQLRLSYIFFFVEFDMYRNFLGNLERRKRLQEALKEEEKMRKSSPMNVNEEIPNFKRPKFTSMTETGTATSDKLKRKRFCNKLGIKF